jgi:hypothetical protein
MGKYRVEENTAPARTGHPDYERNLKSAEAYCEKMKPRLLNGMNVKVADSEHLKKALLIISFKPGFTEKRGNYATPVFLHQSTEDFKRETASTMSFYMKMMKDRQVEEPLHNDFFGHTAIKA